MLTDLADVLRGAALVVHEVSGWQKRGYRGRSLEAVRGVVLHYTAEPVGTNPAAMARLLSVGRSDLPGPLSQLFLDRGGEWWVIAAGYANHAGAGSWPGLRGNPDCIGIEAANTNKGEVPPSVQINSWVHGVAAVCDAYAIPTDNIISHAFWAPHRKTDPFGLDVPTFRASVAAEQRSDMAFTPDEEAQLKEIVAGIRRHRSDAGGLMDVLIPRLRMFTDNQLAELAAFAGEILVRDSNGRDLADVTISHLRAFAAVKDFAEGQDW